MILPVGAASVGAAPVGAAAVGTTTTLAATTSAAVCCACVIGNKERATLSRREECFNHISATKVYDDSLMVWVTFRDLIHHWRIVVLPIDFETIAF